MWQADRDFAETRAGLGGVGWGGAREVIKPLNNLNQTERGVF